MPRIKLPRIRPGDLIADSREAINAASEALERQQLTSGAGIRVDQGPEGIGLSADVGVGFWVKILSGSQPYAWIEQIPQDAFTWADGPHSGTVAVNPAYEATGHTAVPANKIVWLRLAPGSNTMIFESGNC